MPSWPSAVDYQDAIQNSHLFLKDPELQKAEVEVDDILGLPRVSTGRFAAVFQLKTRSGSYYAVRAFISPVTDQQHRYELLSAHLTAFAPPFMVWYEYQSEGISVNGQWYPILKMEWVEGCILSTFIEQHLNDSQVLNRLAAQWRGVVATLNGSEIAHGDLQHGNVMVDNQGNIKLVDYDGVYIPALRGNPPDEVGHPNYQHPERIAKGYYEQNVDNFSSIVIYLSLRALATDPTLWDQFNNGENLIFTQEDFKNPGKTAIWQRLQNNPDLDIQAIAKVLEKCCTISVAKVPTLEKVIDVIEGRKKWEDIIEREGRWEEWIDWIKRTLTRLFKNLKRIPLENITKKIGVAVLVIITAIMIICLAYKIIKNKPSIKTFFTKIESLIEQEKYGEASRLVDRALRQGRYSPSEERKLEEIKEKIKNMVIEKGDYFYREGQYIRAKEMYEMALEYDPYNLELKQKRDQCEGHIRQSR